MTKGERREAKRDKSKRMGVSGRTLAAVYQAAVLKRAKGK